MLWCEWILFLWTRANEWVMLESCREERNVVSVKNADAAVHVVRKPSVADAAGHVMRKEVECQMSPTPQSTCWERKPSVRCRRRMTSAAVRTRAEKGSRVSDVADAWHPPQSGHVLRKEAECQMSLTPQSGHVLRKEAECQMSQTHHIRRSSFSRCYLAQLPTSVFVPIIKEDKEKSIQRMVIIISVTYLTIYYEWIFIKLDPWSIWMYVCRSQSWCTICLNLP